MNERELKTSHNDISKIVLLLSQILCLILIVGLIDCFSITMTTAWRYKPPVLQTEIIHVLVTL